MVAFRDFIENTRDGEKDIFILCSLSSLSLSLNPSLQMFILAPAGSIAELEPNKPGHHGHIQNYWLPEKIIIITTAWQTSGCCDHIYGFILLLLPSYKCRQWIYSSCSVALPLGTEIVLPSFDCKENYTFRESPFCTKSHHEALFNSVNET